MLIHKNWNENEFFRKTEVISAFKIIGICTLEVRPLIDRSLDWGIGSGFVSNIYFRDQQKVHIHCDVLEYLLQWIYFKCMSSIHNILQLQ